MRSALDTVMRSLTMFAALAFASMMAASGPASAQAMMSDWDKGMHSKVRLVSTWLPSMDESGVGQDLYAGVEIALDPVWKTYWRTPGDGGGVPPQFDWRGSQNVKSFEVLYPAPRLLAHPLGDSFGYKSHVTFPVRITPQDPSRPVKLALAVYYGVCLDICIPAEARLKATIAPGQRATLDAQRVLVTALARVPVETRALPVMAAVAKLDGASPALTFDVKTNDSSEEVYLFVEAMDGRYLPMIRSVKGAPQGAARFTIPLGDAVAKDLPGAMLRLTVVDGADGNVEGTWQVPK